MKLLGRSGGSPDEPTTVRRVTGHPGGDPSQVAVEEASPVPARLNRLRAAVDRAGRGNSGRNVRKILQVIGMVAVIFGFVCILLGWYGASHSPYLYQEIPYLISGGMLGLALVFGGGILIYGAWSLRQVEEERRNALAIVRSIDRLERVLRTPPAERAEPEHSLEGPA
jgi:hypothetical protein